MPRGTIAAIILSCLPSGVLADGARPPLAVEIVTVVPASQSFDISLTGELRARDTMIAAFPNSGRVTEMLVDKGQAVAKGAVLARIDALQYEQALRAAEAELNSAAASNRKAADDLARSEALLSRGATTRAARDAAEDAAKVAESAMAEARAQLDRAKKALADTVLIAPQEATVIERSAEAGQVVAAAQPVLELALANGIEAVFEVPEVLLTEDPGPLPIRLARLSDPSVEFSGTMTRVSPLVDTATGTLAVTVEIPAPPQGLTFGEAVRGTASFTQEGKIFLPYTSLARVGNQPAVWRIDPASNTVALVPIEIEWYESGRFVVGSGLTAGDRVIGRGAQLLFPGREVVEAEVTP